MPIKFDYLLHLLPPWVISIWNRLHLLLILHSCIEVASLGVRSGKGADVIRKLPFCEFTRLGCVLHRLFSVSLRLVRACSQKPGKLIEDSWLIWSLTQSSLKQFEGFAIIMWHAFSLSV